VRWGKCNSTINPHQWQKTFGQGGEKQKAWMKGYDTPQEENLELRGRRVEKLAGT